MTEIFLIDALCAYVRNALKNQRLETPASRPERPAGSLFVKPEDKTLANYSTDLKAVQVYGGFLPPKQADEDAVPFVYIRPTSGTVDAGRTTVQVAFTVGVFASDYKGYLDVLNVYRRLSSALTALRSNRLADKYERDTQLSWQWSSSRDDPYWGVDIDTTWFIYTDQPEIEKWL